MSFSLDSIVKGPQIKPPRILLLGVDKIGKTSFACGTRFEDGRIVEYGTNAPIGLPVRGETGMNDLDIHKFPTAQTFKDVMEDIAALYEGKHEYRTLAVDSISTLGPVIYDDVCDEFKVNNVRKVPGFRTGEAAVQKRWRQLLDGLDALQDQGMVVILIGHVKVRNYNNALGDSYGMIDCDLDAEVVELLKRWADVTLFCNTKVVVKKEGEDTTFSKAKKRGIDPTGERFLFTGKHPARPGGGRGIYGHLPDELPLEWAAFQAAVSEAMTK
jgi:hypothetical protein